MNVPREGCLLRVFLGESATVDGRPVYEAIVLKARELKMAGATVLRGVLGFGADSRMHSAKVLALSDDLPLVVEIVDSREKIEELLPYVEEVVKDGMVTLERAEVIFRRRGKGEDVS